MKPNFLFRYAVSDGSGPHRDRLVVFSAGRRFDMTRLIEAVSAEVNERLTPDEVLIVARGSVAKKAIEASQGREFARLSQRLGDATMITVIGYDHAGAEVVRKTVQGDEEGSDANLSEVWRRGGTAIFRRRGGFFESTTAFHFANPSGKHTNRFIRLSNILVSHAEIDFIASANLHLIDHTAEHVYIDTPSLFTVVASINDFRATEGALEPLTADSFRSYDGVEQQAFEHPNATILISASSSGSLAGIVAKRGFANNRIAHVLFLGRKADEARSAINLGHDTDYNPDGFEVDRVEHPSGECRMCASGSQSVLLRGDQFDIAGPQPVPLRIKKEHAPSTLANVMLANAGNGVFRIGSADSAPCRIEASRLFAPGEDAKRLDYVLDLNVPAAAAAVVAVDDASMLLAKQVARRVSDCRSVETLSEFERRMPPDQAFVAPIVVVQSVIGSGRQIVDLSRELRRWPAAPIVYIAGFVATESIDKVAALRTNLEMTWNVARHRLVVVDQLALPTKGEANAWEAEARLLDAAASGGNLTTPALIARRETLTNLARGLADDIFHARADGSRLGLNAGFVFWPDGLTQRPGISQADVFTTVAAVLQGLRGGTRRAPASMLQTAWFYKTVLDPENFGRFNDGVIQASLLRAARPSELDYRDNPGASREAARLIGKIVTDPGSARGDAAREFAFAVAAGRIRLQDEDRERVIGIRSGDPVVDELLSLSGNF